MRAATEAVFVDCGVDDADAAACCGGVDAAARDTQAALDEAAQAVAPAAQGDASDADAPQRELGGHRLRMCPACCAGPLLNEHCSDMRAHHGQCPSCGQRSHTDAAIAEALARVPAGADRICAASTVLLERAAAIASLPGVSAACAVELRGRRERRSGLHQLHVLLCVVARQHVQLPIRSRRRGAQLTAATASIDRHARKALERLTAPLRAAGDVVAAHRRRDRQLLGRPDPGGLAVCHTCSERA